VHVEALAEEKVPAGHCAEVLEGDIKWKVFFKQQKLQFGSQLEN
jgi:hypothetical protein